MGTKQKLTSKDFVHLHNHTQYSLLDGLTKIPELMEFVSRSGMEAVAMTDHGTMSGAIEFYKAAKEAGIKPIIGMEAYIAPRKHTDKDVSKDKNYFHLSMLAMNKIGYQNLMRLSTIANLEGFYYKPRIDHELIEKYNEGIIVLSGCMGGEIADALSQDQYDKARETALWYKSIFGDRYYIELQDHGHPKHPSSWLQQQKVNEQLLKLSVELEIPSVVTSDAHYLRHEDQEAHEILLCVQTGAYLNDTNRMSLKEFELHVAEPKAVIDRWGDDYPELISNTAAIASRCNLEIELGKILIPKFPVPKGETEKSYFHKLVWRGLAEKYGGKSKLAAEKLDEKQIRSLLASEITERADYELGVIDSMKFNGYFLIVSDFINWGKSQGIVFGPGRGSAAGSIVAYATGITGLDPLKYDLLFERFLNPDRISMPDIDIDIQDSRRDEVIQYCIDKYGKDRVANIVTFGRMAARNAVRDVARVLQVPYADADRIAKLIPPPVQGRHVPLAKSLKENPELRNENLSNEQSARVFELATRLEMTIRSHGVHAAGVVITPDTITDFVPLEMAQKGVVATQYSMNPIEDLGLLKMDFLGLSNLTIIKNALRIIRKVYEKSIDINTIPLDDKKTFELLQRGETTGVFQLESAGMRRYLKELKPTVFDDIVAMVALYRPGPMQWIDDFIARKHGIRAIEFLHPAMEPALHNTYGIIVYQEQVMQISKEMCGFTGGQADTLRKAIGKKIPEVMKKLKSEFIDGAITTVGAEREMMEKFWAQLEEFAAYCFNKSHAACYALIAYQTAYLKAHYPAAFMAALMTSDYDNTDRLATEITECQHMGIEVLPPDVNESFHEFAVVPKTNQIRFGLDAVKNVGHGAVEEIIRAREQLGSFKTIEDFFANVSSRIVNKKSVESLAKAGAFDAYKDRILVIQNIDTLLAFGSRLQKQTASGQVDLFSDGSASTEAVMAQINWSETGEPILERELLNWERELLGIYLSHHPLDDYKILLSELTVPINKLTPEMDNKTATIGGSISAVREITTKNGAKMAFVKISDAFGEVETILFPNIYKETAGLWTLDTIIIAKGKLNAKDRDGVMSSEIKLMVNEAREVTADEAAAFQPSGKKLNPPKPKKVSLVDKEPTQAETANHAADIAAAKRLYIRMHNAADQSQLLALKKQLDAYAGKTEVVLVTGESTQKQIIRLPQRLDIETRALEEIRTLFGEPNVVLK